MSIDKQEMSSLSDGSSTAASGGRGGTVSDEEGCLIATSHPKKRAGRRVFKETRHPVFHGVRRRNKDKWVCEVREPNKKSRIWLGTHPTPEMAARAHDVAALALRGKSAYLNFADSTWRLPVPVSNNSEDIKRAAIEAAEMFRPIEFGGSGDGDGDGEGEVRENISSGQKDSSEVCSSNDYKPVQENVFYLDEEMVFDMPGLLSDMANGLLLSPPLYIGDGNDWGHMENNLGDFSLWNY